jgi:ferredoxin--NADP+ reductase
LRPGAALSRAQEAVDLARRILGMSPRSTPGQEAISLNQYRLSAPGIARVLSNDRLTPLRCGDVRHIVLDLAGLDYRYREGQSVGILPPGVNARGHAEKLRLYSIASSRRGDDGDGRTVSLCVKRVVYPDPVTYEEHRGVASNYLCDVKPGDEVAVTGPTGTHFLLPDDPATDLILVATGTGIASFRAFLRRIYREEGHWTGAVSLFFGVRTEAECLYRDEFDSYRDRPRYDRVYALSREQQTSDGQRMYVQHRMAERIDELRDRLERGRTVLYICGLRGMEDGIAQVLDGSASGDGTPRTSFQALRKAGRIRVETY